MWKKKNAPKEKFLRLLCLKDSDALARHQMLLITIMKTYNYIGLRTWQSPFAFRNTTHIYGRRN